MADLNWSWDLTMAPKETERWTPELQGQQLRRMELAVVHDRAAIAALERALATLSADNQ